MERNILIDEIAEFGFKYKLFSRTFNIKDLKIGIDGSLKRVEFIESLINTIIVKTKYRKNVDTERLKDLLIELEKIRLKLEYKK